MEAFIKRIERELVALGDAKIAKTHAGWRESGSPGRYLGVTKAKRRQLARREIQLPLFRVWEMLSSEILDVRSLGVLILVERFGEGEPDARSDLFGEVLSHRPLVTDWELVDDLSPPVIGGSTHGAYTPEIALLSTSSSLWDRRMAIVSTLFSVRNGNLELAFRLAELFLSDTEPLIQKATGWVLRETGKKDPDRLKSFLREKAQALSPTTLSYAIERFSASERDLFRKIRRSKFP